ncbi:isoprenyl transferase [Oleispirillum naphthae]|uniref:isoprenyl transferase n=1 Tax=Oleispirillum naphthae TaxID=2838853 RepID=UPI003082625C
MVDRSEAQTARAQNGLPPVPRHVAIIMDGNGRWAKARHLPRAAGHRKGVEAVREVVRVAGEIGVSYLTLFGFSSENWKRPETEVRDLMGLLRLYLRREARELHGQGVRLRVIGDRARLAADIREQLAEVEALTAANTALTLVIALSYGGRAEIVEAARRLAAEVRDGALAPEAIDEAAFSARLFAPDIPDPDLLIRTSGEQRISNFLLWQLAYTEFVFVETLWPDFDRAALLAALGEYGRRERRYGAITA